MSKPTPRFVRLPPPPPRLPRNVFKIQHLMPSAMFLWTLQVWGPRGASVLAKCFDVEHSMPKPLPTGAVSRRSYPSTQFSWTQMKHLNKLLSHCFAASLEACAHKGLGNSARVPSIPSCFFSRAVETYREVVVSLMCYIDREPCEGGEW